MGIDGLARAHTEATAIPATAVERGFLSAWEAIDFSGGVL